MQKRMTIVYLRFLKLSTCKVQRVLNSIRNKTYREALIFLELMPYKPSLYIWQIILNAISNLKQNLTCNQNSFIIKEAKVDKGPTKKLIRYNARGKYSFIERKSCHIKLSISIYTV